MHHDEKHRIRKSQPTGAKEEPKGVSDDPTELYRAAKRFRFFHRALTCLDFLIHVEVRIPRFWIALVVMVLSSPLLHAQYAVPPWKAGPVDVSGILDGFYSENFNHPDCRINQLHNFDYYSARPRLNMAEVGLSHDPAPLGFEIDFGLGDTYKLVHSTEPDSPLKNILQLTVSLKPSAWHGVQVDFGKFQTSAGIESAETLSGWNYSRSILFVTLSRTTTSAYDPGSPSAREWKSVYRSSMAGTAFSTEMAARPLPLPRTTKVPSSPGTTTTTSARSASTEPTSAELSLIRPWYRRTHAVCSVAVDRSDIRAGDAIMLEHLIEGGHAHGPNPLSDQVANRILDHRGNNAGMQTEAVGEVGGYIEFTAADMDPAIVCLAERNYAWV